MRRLLAGLTVVLLLATGVAVASAGAPPPAPTTLSAQPAHPPFQAFRWRRSCALGKPWHGRLVRGVKLPFEGRDWFTWDFVKREVPNRVWRRYGHDRLIHMLLAVLRDYRAANPGAPRVGVADISRPRGGYFGRRYGGLGHASHQNGLDVDVLYPRLDHTEWHPDDPSQIDRMLAQDLVDRFVAAGARSVFVGPHTGLHGRRRVVRVLSHHDDHMHVRLKQRRRCR